MKLKLFPKLPRRRLKLGCPAICIFKLAPCFTSFSPGQKAKLCKKQSGRTAAHSISDIQCSYLTPAVNGPKAMTACIFNNHHAG